MQGAQVPSLVGELRSCTAWYEKKKKIFQDDERRDHIFWVFLQGVLTLNVVCDFCPII